MLYQVLVLSSGTWGIYLAHALGLEADMHIRQRCFKLGLPSNTNRVWMPTIHLPLCLPVSMPCRATP